MANIAIVAINIVKENANNILNKDCMPILYYWNMDNEDEKCLIDSILSNTKINDILKKYIENLEDYTNTSINYIFYKLNGTKEDYIENKIYIQNYVSIDKISEFFIDKVLEDITIKIYKEVFNADYIIRNNDPIIYDIYAKVNLLNKGSLDLKTFMNYIRAYITKNYNLSSENLDKIVYEGTSVIDKLKKYHEMINE